MKRFALMLLLLAGPALAQAPQDIPSNGQILLSVGGTKALQFQEPIVNVDFAHKGIVEGNPLTDQQLVLSAIAPGVTRMFVRASNGKMIYNVEIVVAPEPGHLVKLYGTSKNDDLNAGYTAVYCTETGCERPDKDLPRPTAITIDRVSRFKEGAVGTR